MNPLIKMNSLSLKPHLSPVQSPSLYTDRFHTGSEVNLYIDHFLRPIHWLSTQWIGDALGHYIGQVTPPLRINKNQILNSDAQSP